MKTLIVMSFVFLALSIHVVCAGAQFQYGECYTERGDGENGCWTTDFWCYRKEGNYGKNDKDGFCARKDCVNNSCENIETNDGSGKYYRGDCYSVCTYGSKAVSVLEDMDNSR